jgi:TATA-binding protein-associated factor Taf7
MAGRHRCEISPASLGTADDEREEGEEEEEEEDDEDEDEEEEEDEDDAERRKTLTLTLVSHLKPLLSARPILSDFKLSEP